MSRKFLCSGALIALLFTLMACDAPSTDDEPPAEASAASEDGPANIDNGGIEEFPDDPALVEDGEGLFASQGCVACHKMDEDGLAPALGDVTERRTAAWMARQIMHPDEMQDADPTTKNVSDGFPAPMPPTNLTADQAKAIIAFLAAQ